jgi:hypothetical protein
MSWLRCRLAAVRLGRRPLVPAGRPRSMNGASRWRSAAAFSALRSISYRAPSIPNRTVSSAGPPSRSSTRATNVCRATRTPLRMHMSLNMYM